MLDFRSNTDFRARCLRFMGLWALCLLAGPAARAELVANGNFSSGLSSWTTSGATPSVVAGEAVVVGRNGRDRGISQNMLAALVPGINGKPFTARCRIKVAQPTPARLQLALTENGVVTYYILAEEVIRDAGVFHELRGTRKIAWTTPLTSAVLFISVGHMTRDVDTLPNGGLFPDYTIDDVSIDDDDDADGLTNAEETTLGTLSANLDSDSDGLPDLWEWRRNTGPTTSSAEADPDGDNRTNRIEFWGATDPHDPASYPGIPSNTHANPAARAVLKYLAELPANGAVNHAVVGQHLTITATEFPLYIAPLGAAPINRWPGVVAFQYDDGGNPPDTTTPESYAIDHWNSGGLVEIKYNPRNPWTGGFYDYSLPDLVNIPGLLNPTTPEDVAARAFFISDLDIIAAGLKRLEDAHVVVLWRYMSEMNGAHFWWGYRGQSEYVGVWRFIHDYFSDPQGWNLRNLLYVYESHTPAHSKLANDYYYPGDAYVDLMGHNYYHTTFHLDFQANEIYSRYPKVYCCPQTGPENDPAYRDGTFSNLNYLNGTDNASGFIHDHPRLSYFAVWNSFHNVYDHHISIVDNPNAVELMNHNYVVTRDELPSAQWFEATSAARNWAIYR